MKECLTIIYKSSVAFTKPSDILFFLLFYRFTFTYMCIHCLGYTPHSRNMFWPLVLWFCWRENIRDNKKDIAFLLVWGKYSYTKRFLAFLPCTCVLQPTLVHLYYTSSLLPSPFPIVASVSLRLLYLLLYSEHFNHIQILISFPFPIPPMRVVP
jgi:hypothetical protein